jgi:hypothetical protein
VCAPAPVQSVGSQTAHEEVSVCACAPAYIVEVSVCAFAFELIITLKSVFCQRRGLDEWQALLHVPGLHPSDPAETLMFIKFAMSLQRPGYVSVPPPPMGVCNRNLKEFLNILLTLTISFCYNIVSHCKD